MTTGVSIRGAEEFLSMKRDNQMIEAASNVERLTMLLTVAPTDEERSLALYDRAYWYEAGGDDTSAVKDYTEALTLTSERSLVARIKMQVALLLLKKVGLQESALFWAAGAVDRDPKNANGWHILAMAYAACEYHRLAIDAIRRALELSPNFPEATLKLGRYLREAAQDKESVQVLSEYVAQYPNQAEGIFELGLSTQMSFSMPDRHERALTFYRRALEANPTPPTRAMIEQKMHDIESS